jgi:hypothetical protein
MTIPIVNSAKETLEDKMDEDVAILFLFRVVDVVSLHFVLLSFIFEETLKAM